MKQNVLSIGISNRTSKEDLKYVLQFLGNPKKKCTIVTPNPEIVVYATHHSSFKNILNEANVALCDGIGLYLGAKFLGISLKERVSGTDFMETICKEIADQPVTVGFLGGKEGIAELAAECLRKKYSGLKVVIAEAGNPDEKTAKDLQRRLRQGVSVFNQDAKNDTDRSILIDKKGRKQATLPPKLWHHVDILFVGFGFPRQEEWIHAYLTILPVTVAMTVGGAFDYLSGQVPRAPRFLRRIGLEWLYRLLRQPWRLKRQLALLEFISLILKEKFRKSSFE